RRGPHRLARAPGGQARGRSETRRVLGGRAALLKKGQGEDRRAEHGQSLAASCSFPCLVIAALSLLAFQARDATGEGFAFVELSVARTTCFLDEPVQVHVVFG